MNCNDYRSALPMFRQAVPSTVRVCLLVLFAVVFQMSDGVYMSLAGQIASSSPLNRLDVMMCGYCAIIGVTMAFPLLFPLKSFGTTRTNLICVSLGMMVCNVAVMCCSDPKILVAISFLFGILKLWGTFECMSSLMRIITPDMNFAPFLTVVFVIVFGSIQLSGIVGESIASALSWKHMNLFAVCLEAVVVLCAVLLMKTVRQMPKGDLKSIDWVGMLLWGAMLVGCTFVFVYGEYFGWFRSPRIVGVTIAVLALGAVNLLRMRRKAHPYLERDAMNYPNLWLLMAVFGAALILMSSEKVLQNILTDNVMQADGRSASILNWFVFAGIVAGGAFTLTALTRWHWGFRQMTLVSMSAITLYAASLYLLSEPSTSHAALCIPSFMIGFGDVALFIALTTYVELVVPLKHRFQVLCILGFVRTGIASPIGCALYGHCFAGAMARRLSTGAGEIESTVFCIKELYALTAAAGLLAIILLVGYRFRRAMFRKRV